MWRRVRVYFVGVLLGCIVTWALLLRGRNLDDYMRWTPNQRVLTEFNSDSLFVLNDTVLCHLKCHGFKSNDYKALFEEGNVLFTESNPRKMPKMYRIQHQTEKRGSLILELEIDENNLKKVVKMEKEGEKELNCNCPTL